MELKYHIKVAAHDCFTKEFSYTLECLNGGILISIISYNYFPSEMKYVQITKKCFAKPVVLVISPTRENAQNAKMNMAFGRRQRNRNEVVCCKASTNRIKMDGVFGSLESIDDLHF